MKPFSTRRTKAAPLSQHSRASSAEPATASGPTRIRYSTIPINAAMPALARRSRISMTRLLIGESDRPAALEGPDESHLIGIFEVAPDRQPAGDPGHGPADRLESLGKVHRGGLAFERRVGGHDHLDERLTIARGAVRPLQQLADAQLVRPDAVDRRDRPVEDVVEALELPGPLQGEHVERLLDHAQARRVAARVATDRAERLVADVEAAVTEDDLV